MKAVVFSRDRAMQLDLLLTSLERNAPGIFDVTVLWFSRKEEFQEGYRICAEEHPTATFKIEDGLTYQVRSALRDGGLVTFFTDDDVLYRKLPVFSFQEDEICFSLRLGLNTTHCYPHGTDQRFPRWTAPSRPRWRWKGAQGDLGYPMSLDGHVFHATDIEPLITNFTTPNWLEVMLMREVKKIKKPYMACLPESCLVGIPANRVQDDMPNRNGETFPYSVQELNHRYLLGERIDLDALDFSDIRGAHQEIPLVFR